MGELGELFGFLIIMFYALALLNFCLKFLNRHCQDTLKKNEGFYKLYMKLLKFFLKYHKYFGGATIVMILIHFFIQFTRFGISITGGIAAGTMLLQIGLGIVVGKQKSKNKVWLIVHKGIAALLLVAILIHII